MAQQKQTGQRIFRIGIDPETGELDHDRAVAKLMELEAVLSAIGGTISFAAVRAPVGPHSPDEQVTVELVGRWRSYSIPAPEPELFDTAPPAQAAMAPEVAEEAQPAAAEPEAERLEDELAPGDAAEAAAVLDAIEDATTGAASG